MYMVGYISVDIHISNSYFTYNYMASSNGMLAVLLIEGEKWGKYSKMVKRAQSKNVG